MSLSDGADIIDPDIFENGRFTSIYGIPLDVTPELRIGFTPSIHYWMMSHQQSRTEDYNRFLAIIIEMKYILERNGVRL